MSLLNIEDLEPGMVLGADAIHDNNRILLCAGAELTEKHIRIFKTWGLTELNIKGIDSEQISAQTYSDIAPEVLDKVKKELAILFRHSDLEHPAIAELFRLRMRQIVMQKTGEGNLAVDT